MTSGAPRRPSAGRHAGLRITLAASLMLGAATLATGCQSTERPKIERAEPADKPGLTALERGEVRREILDDVKAGWAAFEADDAEGIRHYFVASMADSFDEKRKKYADAGRTRHRAFKINFMDVTELSADGSSATVNAEIVINSYFIEPDGTKTEPYGKETNVRINVVRDGDGYKIRRVLANADLLR